MRCQKALKRIPLLAGEDLPPGRAARLRKHLEGCPDCRRELETVRAALEALRAAARRERIEDWPERAWRALLARVTAEEPGARKAPPGWGLTRTLAAGTAGALVLAGLLLVFKDKIFRYQEIAPSTLPAIAEKTETPVAESPDKRPEPGPGEETSALDREYRTLAETRPGGEPSVSPTGGAQDVVSVTLVSQESGLQVVWFFDRNFEWKGDER